jgi:hypothetical protein
MAWVLALPDSSRTAVIAPDGDVLELHGIASVAFPPGTIRPTRAVRLYATRTDETALDFEATAAATFGADRLLQHEIRLNTGDDAPAAAVHLRIVLPQERLRAVEAGHQPRALVQFWQDGGEEILDQFEPVDADFESAPGTVSLILDPAAFTNGRRVDGTFEAVVVIVSLPALPGRRGPSDPTPY